MQRAIFVPKSFLAVDGTLPQEALDTAAATHMQVVIADDGGQIRIGTIPHEKWMRCDQSVRSGFSHIIEIVDEFITFSREFAIEYVSPSGSTYRKRPRVNERHKLFFVGRFTEIGTYKYSVFESNIVDEIETRVQYCSGSFEVV